MLPLPSTPYRPTLTLNNNNKYPLPIANTLFISIQSHHTFHSHTRKTTTLTTNKLTTTLQYVTLNNSIQLHKHYLYVRFCYRKHHTNSMTHLHSLHFTPTSLFHSIPIKQTTLILFLIWDERRSRVKRNTSGVTIVIANLTMRIPLSRIKWLVTSNVKRVERSWERSVDY